MVAVDFKRHPDLGTFDEIAKAGTIFGDTYKSV
jgi:hypothetical protein